MPRQVGAARSELLVVALPQASRAGEPAVALRSPEGRAAARQAVAPDMAAAVAEPVVAAAAGTVRHTRAGHKAAEEPGPDTAEALGSRALASDTGVPGHIQAGTAEPRRRVVAVRDTGAGERSHTAAEGTRCSEAYRRMPGVAPPVSAVVALRVGDMADDWA